MTIVMTQLKPSWLLLSLPHPRKSELCTFFCMEPFHFSSTVFHLHLVALTFLFEVFPVNCNALGQCLQVESSALLQLKRGFISSEPELKTWRPGTDCCIWEGVTCDESRRVTGLNLSIRSIVGTIDPSLFNLTSLHNLNFSYNRFDRMSIPDSGWDKLANLSSLDLSHAGFVGKVPAGISRLTKLTHLDLSYNLGLSFTINPTFLRDMSSLRELYLNYVNLSAYGDEWCGALINSTPALEALSMDGCSLFGSDCSSLSRLPFLSVINLADNHLDSSILNSFVNFTSLSELRIQGNEFKGFFPSQIFKMRTLKYLNISFNPMLSGSLPDFPEDSNLKIMALSHTNFSGNLPDTIGNLKFLIDLNLSGCQFYGRMPSLMGNLSQLVSLDLSNNSFSGPIPTSLFTLPALRHLVLHDNQFSGQLAEFSNASPLLIEVDLSKNKLQGQIPISLFQISGLVILSLAWNNFSGVVELEFIKDLKNLSYLDLSNSGFSLNAWDTDDGSSSSYFPNISTLKLVGCNLTKIPAFIKYQHRLFTLDLSNNRIHGELSSIFWSVSEQNRLTSFIPSNISSHPYLTFLYLTNNKLTGEIPLSLCNLTKLQELDLDDNMLTGSIPRCLFEEGIHLQVLFAKGNQLHGAIPHEISPKCKLKIIDLRYNQLEGLLPRSISNCRSLVIIDVANNNLKDTFPYWLGNLSSLRVVVLRSNKFHGLVGCSDRNHETNYMFPMLHVLDISSNNFSGSLCAELFSNFKTMMVNRADTIYDLAYNLGVHYFDLNVPTIMKKGQFVTLQNFWMILRVIDFSNNHFEGEIPITIGKLVSLQVLNMSQNNFTGKIPPQLGNLLQLESLDLSMNDLSGKIPQELVSLYFLSWLNLSYNKLVGKIPSGGQFCTFPNTSFEGNMGLHWFPCNTLAPVVNNTSTSPSGLGGTENRSYMIVLGVLFGVGFGFGMATVVVLDVMCYDKWRRRSKRHI